MYCDIVSVYMCSFPCILQPADRIGDVVDGPPVPKKSAYVSAREKREGKDCFERDLHSLISAGDHIVLALYQRYL